MNLSNIGVGHLDPSQITGENFRNIVSTVMGPDDQLKLLPCAAYDAFDYQALRMFTHLNARYLLPTVELVEFLKDRIGSQKAIEIGSGSGDLARFLDIPATDNYCQSWPAVRSLYETTGQPTIQYGEHVERIDAADAVEKYKPDVVIGAWVTQWIDPELPPPLGGGNVFGIKEDELIRKVKTYIVVGAEEIHRHKFIMKLPHETIDASHLVRSRRKDNRIWIWQNTKG